MEYAHAGFDAVAHAADGRAAQRLALPATGSWDMRRWSARISVEVDAEVLLGSPAGALADGSWVLSPRMLRKNNTSSPAVMN